MKTASRLDCRGSMQRYVLGLCTCNMFSLALPPPTPTPRGRAEYLLNNVEAFCVIDGLEKLFLEPTFVFVLREQ